MKKHIAIRIRTKDPNGCIDEIYEAVRYEARVWKMPDTRRKRNLRINHQTKQVEGSVCLINKKKDGLTFECKARKPDHEAVVAGRFVNLVLRRASKVKEIVIEP